MADTWTIMCKTTAWIEGRRHRCGLRPEHGGDHECIRNCGTRWANDEASSSAVTTEKGD